ncbi:MAG: hypothetical protein WBF58_02125 [Xanthobacteraceae bacterium]
MTAYELLKDKRGEFGPWLRRAFWLPLRGVLRMFHVLPVCAALVIFVLLASDGQLREIYASYLEDLGSANPWAVGFRLGFAAFALALISAVLYEAHYLLSRDRVDAVYSRTAGLGSGSRLHHVRDVAAVVLALSPWLGIFFGLLNVKIYLADLFAKLQKAGATGLGSMQHVPMPGPLAIIVGIIVLGLALSDFVAAEPKSRTLQRSIILVTPATAALFFLLLTTSPQINPSTSEIVETCAILCGVTALYYLIYERLYSMRALVFSRAIQQGTGLNLRKHYRLLLFTWALLPWIVAVGSYFVVGAPRESGGLHSWAMIPIAMSWVISIGLLVTFLLHRYRGRAAVKWSIYAIVVSLAVVGLLVSWLPAGMVVAVYRAVGPLGTMAFTLLFLISVLSLLAVLSQRSSFPALTLVILAFVGSVLVPLPPGWTLALLTILCLAVFVMALVARLGAVACVALILALTGSINFVKLHGMKQVSLRPAAGAPTLQAQFNSWLSRTRPMATASGPAYGADAATPAACAARYAGTSDSYPVFIIAVEGGGIYAASAASMFLARLQDRDPCFAQHVFAISAVSGGAIGATIFQAVEQSPPPQTASAGASAANSASSTSGCVPPAVTAGQARTSDALEMEVCAIIEDDHFSPLVSAIFPELLGFTRNGRAQELAASFGRSVRSRNPKAAAILDQPFDEFVPNWSKSGTAPAPVLNSTWVETGYRVAYAPFPLHAIDGSLYSFVDQNMPDDRTLTLLKAAVVSARFPAVLPPYSLLVDGSGPAAVKGVPPATAAKPPGPMRWNFVDGGYSDTSGAATALALYNALKPVARTDHVVLHVILLTSSDPRLEANDINGTMFADTLGPIDAMLSVRDGLGNEAVARACDGILGAGAAGGCEDFTSNPNSPVQIVGIEDETYGLSLGWKISRTTFGVVSWMLGDQEFVGDFCKGGTAPKAGPTPQANGQFTLNEKTVCANSRVQDTVLKSLK